MPSSSRRGKRRYACAFLFLAFGLLAGCSNESGGSSIAPVVVCGTTIAPSNAAVTVYDVTTPAENPSVLRDLSAEGGRGADVYVRVAKGCSVGSDVTLSPPSGLRVVGTALADDGLPVAVVLEPVRSVLVHLVARQHGRVVGSWAIDIPADEIGPAGQGSSVPAGSS